MNIQKVFSAIYDSNTWGSLESRSGEGSTLRFTPNIRRLLPALIKMLGIKTIVDTSCGDWNWMQTIRRHLPQYTGIDIVEAIVAGNTARWGSDSIRFVHGDLLHLISEMPDRSVDLILCRHTLEHLPQEYNLRCLEECRRVAQYLLVTSFNRDIGNSDLDESSTNPYRPINLSAQPYSDILGRHHVQTYYDGPDDVVRDEMIINLYRMTSC